MPIPGLATLISWVAMPLVRYVLIAAAGLLFTAFMRHNAASPWKNQVTELKQVIATREGIIKDHESAVTASEQEAEELKVKIESIIHASAGDKTACVLSASQLAELRKLAGTR